MEACTAPLAFEERGLRLSSFNLRTFFLLVIIYSNAKLLHTDIYLCHTNLKTFTTRKLPRRRVRRKQAPYKYIAFQISFSIRSCAGDGCETHTRSILRVNMTKTLSDQPQSQLPHERTMRTCRIFDNRAINGSINDRIDRDQLRPDVKR